MDLRFQAGQFIPGIVPEDRIFNAEIPVGDDIAEPGNLLPVGVRIPFPEILREALYRFAYHLKIPDDRIPAPAIFGKLINGYPICVVLNIAD